MQYKKYRYAVFTKTGLMLSGILEFINPVNADEATTFAARDSARIANDMEIPFDPFNLKIAVKPIKPRRRKPKYESI